jgi:hypothetical protein
MKIEDLKAFQTDRLPELLVGVDRFLASSCPRRVSTPMSLPR